MEYSKLNMIGNFFLKLLINFSLNQSDSPPSFSSLHPNENIDSSNANNISGWCQFTTKSFCKNVSQVLPLPNEEKSKEINTSNMTETPSDLYKSSEILCKTKSSKKCVIKKGRWWSRIHVIASIASTLLLALFMISEWAPSILNGSFSSENTTSVTYTNVVITPCGNYFWHSAGGSGGNWESSDLASKHDEKLLEETSHTGVDWGYNRIIGNLRKKNSK